MTTYHLSEIWIYPIKSLQGLAQTSANVLPKGLQYDRRLALIDSTNTVVTQRDIPEMALFRLSISGPELVVKHNDDSITVPMTPNHYCSPEEITVWDDKVQACEVGTEYNKWFSSKLNQELRLMFFPERNSRPVDKDYSLADDHVSLADAYPVLIIGQESLNELNQRLASPVPMNRFRPNLVFTGGEAFDEDKWKDFSITTSDFAAVKPCGRCVLTTIDQDTAKAGKEPLKTLSSYRSAGSKVQFGQNLIVIKGRQIKIGDEIIIHSHR